MTLDQYRNIVDNGIRGIEIAVCVNDVLEALRWMDFLERFLQLDTKYVNEDRIDLPGNVVPTVASELPPDCPPPVAHPPQDA